jgi:uncharacterized delta-60 repeat protein
MLKAIVSGVIAVVFASLASPGIAADGQPDPGFGTDGIAYLTYDSPDGNQLRDNTMVVLPDGKLLFGGARNKIIPGNPDPDMRAMLARMNADGSVDATFGGDAANPGVVILPDLDVGQAMQVIEAIAPLGDGSVIVAGTLQAMGPLTGFVVKVDANGVPDATFGTNGVVLFANAYFHAIGVTDRGRILVAGEKRDAGVTTGIVIALDPSGQFDSSFGAAADGIAALPPGANGESGYLNALLVSADGGAIVGGAYESYGSGMGTDFSLARFGGDGLLDTTFANGGWRNFPLEGDASTGNSITRLLAEADGTIMFVGGYQDATTGSNVVLGRLLANGDSDDTFGDATTPGFQRVALLPDAWFRIPTGLVRQDDGKLLVSATYGTPDRQQFLAFRTLPNGALDSGFGTAGVVNFDLAPNGVYSDSEAIALQDGKPIIAGFVKRDSDPASTLLELAAVRLTNGSGDDDTIFRDGFDGAPVAPVVSNYDDLTEGFLGTSYQYNGVNYHDVNGIGGVFPDGSTFTAADVGNLLIVENATDFFLDFPDYGSSPNTLTFGTSFSPGDNVSIGAFVQASMDLDQPANAVSVDMAYYENGPWGGIEFHLDAYRNGSVVGSTSLTIADGGGRDDATTSSLAISGVEFDSLKMYATYDGQPSAPRLMIDNLSLTPAGSIR